MHVILAAGGTGGHLFPAWALGQSFEKDGHKVMFVGSGRPLDRHVEKISQMPWKHLTAGRLKGVGLVAKLKSFILIPWSLLHALIILIKEKPDLVIGVGGYSTGPLLLMARFVAIPTAILEQNSIPGFTNRMLAPFAKRIFVALPISGNHWQSNKKLRVCGNPIRQHVINQFETSQKSSNRFTLLTFGGSQGAHFLNEVMLRLLPQLQRLANQIKIIHITGETDFERVSEAYRAYPQLQVIVRPFSDHIGNFYKEADLVFSRAGAATISDLMRFGRAAVLIPYPFAADRHQHANARYLAKAGAALMWDQQDFEPEVFWQHLLEWVKDGRQLQEMAAKAHALAPEAPAQRIIAECKQLVGNV